MMTAGAYDGEKTVVGSGESMRTFFIKDGTLRGYIILGDVAGAGIYTSLIERKRRLRLSSSILFSESRRLPLFRSPTEKRYLPQRRKPEMTKIDAHGLGYRELNEELRRAEGEIEIDGCMGQRFIASGMSGK